MEEDEKKRPRAISYIAKIEAIENGLRDYELKIHLHSLISSLKTSNLSQGLTLQTSNDNEKKLNEELSDGAFSDLPFVALVNQQIRNQQTMLIQKNDEINNVVECLIEVTKIANNSFVKQGLNLEEVQQKAKILHDEAEESLEGADLNETISKASDAIVDSGMSQMQARNVLKKSFGADVVDEALLTPRHEYDRLGEKRNVEPQVITDSERDTDFDSMKKIVYEKMGLLKPVEEITSFLRMLFPAELVSIQKVMNLPEVREYAQKMRDKELVEELK